MAGIIQDIFNITELRKREPANWAKYRVGVLKEPMSGNPLDGRCFLYRSFPSYDPKSANVECVSVGEVYVNFAQIISGPQWYFKFPREWVVECTELEEASRKGFENDSTNKTNDSRTIDEVAAAGGEVKTGTASGGRGAGGSDEAVKDTAWVFNNSSGPNNAQDIGAAGTGVTGAVGKGNESL